MRIFFWLVICLITACSSRPNSDQQAVNRVADFYAFYLRAILQTPPPGFDSPEMRSYVANDTLERLTMIQKIPEQEILGADYFTYTQDYDASWIPALKVGPARDQMGGKIVDVWLGIDAGKHEHLKAYLRQEAGLWKIYRVRDISSNYEAPIFNAGRIQRGW